MDLDEEKEEVELTASDVDEDEHIDGITDDEIYSQIPALKNIKKELYEPSPTLTNTLVPNKEEVKCSDNQMVPEPNVEFDEEDQFGDPHFGSPGLLNIEEDMLKYEQEDFVLGEPDPEVDFSSDNLYTPLLN